MQKLNKYLYQYACEIKGLVAALDVTGTVGHRMNSVLEFCRCKASVLRTQVILISRRS